MTQCWFMTLKDEARKGHYSGSVLGFSDCRVFRLSDSQVLVFLGSWVLGFSVAAK